LQTPFINIALSPWRRVIIYFMPLLMNHSKNTVKWKWEFKAGPFLKLFLDDLLNQYRLRYRPKWDIHNPRTHPSQP